MSAKRISVIISDEDKLWLDWYTGVQKISVGEAVRQGIRQLKRDQRQKTYQRLINITFGIWRQENGLAYQKKVRETWE